jgi:hypothetical protein
MSLAQLFLRNHAKMAVPAFLGGSLLGLGYTLQTGRAPLSDFSAWLAGASCPARVSTSRFSAAGLGQARCRATTRPASGSVEASRRTAGSGCRVADFRLSHCPLC